MKHKTCVDIFNENKQVLEEYLSEWNLYPLYLKMESAANDKHEKDLIKQANEAWFALPDRRAIRSQGFFALCDIAERMYE